MEFLGMIALGILGLFACSRLFVMLLRLMGMGFNNLESQLMNYGSPKRKKSYHRWDDDDDD